MTPASTSLPLPPVQDHATGAKPRTGAGWAGALLASGLLVLSTAVSRGQQPILPPVVPPSDLAVQTAIGTGEDIVGNPIAVQPDDLPPAYQNGSLTLRPHFLYRLLYGDGIQASPGHKSSTFIDTLAPGLFASIGSHWIVDYTPSWDIYSNSAFEDTVDQTLNISGNETFDTWTVQFSQSYIKSSQPLVETGVQTNEQDYITSLAIAHVLSDRFAVEADLYQYLRYAKGFPDSNNWSDTDWLNYRINSQLIAGVGVALGFVKDSGQPDATFTNPEVRLTWKPGKKLTLSADVGSEHREFYGHPKTGLTSPTFDVYLDYAIFDRTRLKASAGRQISDSYFAGETTKNTFWNVSVEQRLLKHWTLSAGFGNDDTDYVATLAETDQVRHDTEITYNGRLSWTFLRRGTLALLYNSTRDRATVAGYGFTSNQVGLEATYRY